MWVGQGALDTGEWWIDPVVMSVETVARGGAHAQFEERSVGLRVVPDVLPNLQRLCPCLVAKEVNLHVSIDIERDRLWHRGWREVQGVLRVLINTLVSHWQRGSADYAPNPPLILAG